MDIKKSNLRAWSRLGQRGSVFAILFPELAQKIDNLKLLTADLSLLSGMERYTREFPDKFLNTGIAEQNMIGIAAGLAMEGHCVFATTYASFIAVRSLEQVRQHLAHMGCNVKVIGSSAGVTAAKSGISHWATEDIAFTRVLPNLKVFSPADALEAMKIAQYAAHTEGPMYIRLSGGLNCPIVYQEDYEWQAGKNNCLREGDDVAILATGLMVKEALDAAEILDKSMISAEVINVSSIKPLDTENLQALAEKYSTIVTVEEHNVLGGMGSAVAEFMTTLAKNPRIVRIGFRDTFLKAGSPRFVWEQAGITAEQIAKRIREELLC